jgi:succinyl-diaminopimelate desuccinylase
VSAQDIVGELQALAGADITFEILDDKPPVETSPDHPFVCLCQESCRSILGREPSVGGVPYFSDAAILSPALDLPWVIIGPGETGMSGQRDEYVYVDKVIAAADIYMQIATNHLRN